MKGEWKAYSQVVGDSRLYIAGRQLDMSKPLHSGNIEYCGGYSEDKDVVDRWCNELNRQPDAAENCDVARKEGENNA